MALKILGIIPARAGSKGVPHKNIKPLGGRPLIAHTIKVAKEAACLDRVIVSTDSDAIAEVARNWGGEVPWLRPVELATDNATVIDVVMHVLERLAHTESLRPDAVMLLQPTSPFRSASTIQAAVRMHEKASYESVISVSVARDHPFWCKSIGPEGTLEDFWPQVQIPVTRQELPPAYCLNGLIFLASAHTLVNSRSFYSLHTRALVVTEEEALDIDTPLDWQLAQCLWDRRAGGEKA